MLEIPRREHVDEIRRLGIFSVSQLLSSRMHKSNPVCTVVVFFRLDLRLDYFRPLIYEVLLREGTLEFVRRGWGIGSQRDRRLIRIRVILVTLNVLVIQSKSHRHCPFVNDSCSKFSRTCVPLSCLSVSLFSFTQEVSRTSCLICYNTNQVKVSYFFLIFFNSK